MLNQSPRPLIAVGLALTMLMAISTTQADSMTAPTGRYLDVFTEVVYWFDSVSGYTAGLNSTDYQFESCIRSGAPTQTLKSRCGYCGYVPESTVIHPPGTTWRNGAEYTYGACVNAEIVGANVIYRADVRVKHSGANNTYNWSAHVQPQSLVAGGLVGGAWTRVDGGTCINDAPVSYCYHEGVAEHSVWSTTTLPPGTAGFAFELRIYNGTATNQSYLTAAVLGT